MKRTHLIGAARVAPPRSIARGAAAALCLLVLAAPAAHAEDWAGLSKRLAAQCVAFHAEVQDITIDMEMTNPSTDGAIVTGSKLYQKGERFRAEISIGAAGSPAGAAGAEDLMTTIVDDGSSVWILNPAIGKSEIPKTEGSKYRGQWYCGDFLPGEAEVQGVENVSGRDCYVLLVRDEASPYARIWIDAKSLVPVKLESRPEEGETTTAVFSDFRPITREIEIPYVTEIFAGADLISTVVIKSLVVNSGISDTLFDPDASVEGETKSLQDLLEKVKQKMEKAE